MVAESEYGSRMPQWPVVAHLVFHNIGSAVAGVMYDTTAVCIPTSEEYCEVNNVPHLLPTANNNIGKSVL